MRGQIGIAFFMFFAFIFVVFIPDLIVYGTLSYKANSVVEQTTKEAEMQGGITSSVQNQVQSFIKDFGLEDKGFTITYDSTGQMQHRERFEVSLQGQYTFRAFNFLGTGIGNFSLPITAVDSGVSEVWYR